MAKVIKGHSKELFSRRKFYWPVLHLQDLGTFVHKLKIPILAPEVYTVPRKNGLASILWDAL